MRGIFVRGAITAVLVLGVLAAAGCSPPPAPPPAPEANHPAPPPAPETAAPAPPPAPAVTSSASAPVPPAASSLPAVEQRRRYVGFACGLAYRERGTSVRLPEGLTLVRAVHTAAPVHLVVAQRGDDLVTLLLDDRGVVTDSVELLGAAADYQLVPGCSEGDADVDIALVPRACKGPVTAPRAWNGRGRKLQPAGARVTCVCDA